MSSTNTISPLDFLAASSVFRDVAPALLAETEALWAYRQLDAWEPLWSADTPADELALVLSGRLEVFVGDYAMAKLGPGELLGEASAFLRGETRTATVRAIEATRVLVLGQPQLQRMRLAHPDVYDALLARALLVLAQRIADKGARIARLSDEGDPVDLARADGDGRWQRYAASAPTAPVSPIPALRLLPVLMSAPDDVLARIAGALAPRFVEAGRALFLAGDPGDAVYVVARGRIDVMRHVRAGGVARAATIEPGSLIGTGALLLDGPRNATCVAPAGAWVFELSRAAVAGLDRDAARLVRESLLCALRSQLVDTDAAVTRLEARRASRFTGDATLTETLHGGSGEVAYQPSVTDSPIEVAALPALDGPPPLDEKKRRLLETIRGAIIGQNEALDTPYGLLRVTYADYTASGRCLEFIEDFMRDEVMPTYANTHTEASGTGRQTTRFREDARQIVRESVGANDEDAVIFVGSGATGAIHKLIDMLGVRVPPALETAYNLTDKIPPERRPVVFIGPYEHHSNELPWRHSIADVVVIDDDDDGRIDLDALEQALVRHADRPLKIGSFSAASNVTGIVSDTHAVAALLHRHGALSFWDYAAAGPYAKIDMNPGGLAYKDAVFISPHKFIGGPGSPGVLVVKRRLAENPIPTQPGGGTVAMVTPNTVVYARDIEHREEAGTPAILESIRCGLAFHLKRSVGADAIHTMEQRFVRRAIDVWRANPNIRIVGSLAAERLSIVSMMFRYGGRYLHYNFIVTVLNDLFGIQARGGCSCAGPYMHRLLGLDAATSHAFACMIERGFSALNPGWARVNFNYFISDAEFEYIVAAVNLVGLYGHLLVADYVFDARSGQWHHRAGQPHRPMRLLDLRYGAGRLEYPSRHASLPEDALRAQLDAARRVLEGARRRIADMKIEPFVVDAEYDRLRWFATPAEIVRDLQVAATADFDVDLEDAPLDARMETYRAALAAAYPGGTPNAGGVAVLAALRRSLGIRPEEHRRAYESLRA